jgi:hypothetical protein
MKVSLQDSDLEIYEETTHSLLHRMSLTGNDLLSNEGGIRLGTELIGPNQSFEVEFDNVFVYDKCP